MANSLRWPSYLEFVTLREFAVLGKHPLDTLSVTTIQSPGRVPWQQRLNLVALSLLIDQVSSLDSSALSNSATG